MSLETNPSYESYEPDCLLFATPNIFAAVIPQPMVSEVEECRNIVRTIDNDYGSEDVVWSQEAGLSRSFGRGVRLQAEVLVKGDISLCRIDGSQEPNPEVEVVEFTPVKLFSIQRQNQPMSVSWRASDAVRCRLEADRLEMDYLSKLGADPIIYKPPESIDKTLNFAAALAIRRANVLLDDFKRYFPDSKLKRASRMIGGLLDGPNL